MRFSVFFAFIAAALPALADVQSGVVRSGGQPIPGAAVIVECGTEKIRTVTGPDGKFEVGGLPSTPCQFNIAMFGFEQTQQEVKPSGTPVTFDLKLQTRATVPVEKAAQVAVVKPPAAPAASAATPAPAPAATATTTPPAGPGRGGRGQGGPGRGGAGAAVAGTGRGGAGAAVAGTGRGGPGRGAQGAANGGGFQNLSLVQNGEALSPDVETNANVANLAEMNGGAAEALTISGSLSQAVQTQNGDGMGMGGPMGLGMGGPGGPGGIAGGGDGFGGIGGAGGADNLGGAPGLGADGGFGGGRGGPGGGRGGPGGPPGGGFAGGGRGGGGFGGGPGGGGFGGGGGRGGGAGGRGGANNQRAAANGRGQFGNRINRARGPQWRLSANYNFGNSALNARPYSFTAPQLINGQPVPKAAYANNQFGFSVGGPLAIPKLFKSEKTQWFLNYTGQRTKNGYDRISTVPGAAQRAGDFSGLTQTTSGLPQLIYDPTSNTPFAGNRIPASRLNPVAVKLLSYIPLPNADATRNNFQLIGANPSNSNNIQVNVNQNITTKDRLAFNLSHQNRDSVNVQNFGFRDPTDGSGLNSTLSYSRTISRYLINSLGVQFSRNVTNQYSFFSNGANISGDLGITGTSTNPLAYGPPTISFTNFGSLSDGLPSLNRAQTAGLTETLTFIHGKHNMSYGTGFQRRQTNLQTNQGARGSFNFTGVATQQIGADGLQVSGTGYDLADYLLDRPYGTSINQYLGGNNSFYLRQTAANAYVSDDWRWKTNLSITAGLRWEYFGPMTEKNNRLANLDVAPGYTAVAIVTPGSTSPYSSGTAPSGLIESRPLLFSPRLGIAWRPIKSKQIVVRAGYGIYYTGGVYGAFGTRLALQQPFVRTVNQTTTPINPLTLENGFNTIPGQTIQNTFAVSRDYDPAYAQSWNLSLQETVFKNYVVQLGYQGTKGTHLDVLQSPNRAPLGGSSLTTQQRLQIANASTFQYDISAGNSIYNAAQLSVLRRMARGRSFNVTYVFSKAIDDTSTLGGGVVQIVDNIRAERALSNYDQRHRLNLTYSIQSPVGSDRTSWKWHAIRGWNLNSRISVASGSPRSATVAGDPSGTGIVGGARAQATGQTVEGSVNDHYFNVAAFALPATGTYGNAGRNTIPGVTTFTMNASVFRSFRIKDRHTLTFTVNATNPINTVNVTGFSTTIGSINAGLPTTASGMRSITASTRFNW